MGDVSNLASTSTNDNITQTNSLPVIENDQSSENLENLSNAIPVDDLPISRVQSDEHEPNANLSEYIVDCKSLPNTSAPLDEAHYSGKNCLCPAEEGAPSQNLPDDTALCGENVDDNSSVVSPANLEVCNNNTTNPTFNNNISNENNLNDSVNETKDHSSVYFNGTSFDKSNYSVGFIENLPKIEKKDSLMASDLISSETMNDFFDEMYDMNYVNHYKIRKNNESNNSAQNSYSTDDIEGSLRSQNWSISTPDSDSCSHRLDQSTNSATIKSSFKRFSETELNKDYLPCKKPRKGITFDSVSVYYFPRTQGFTCIPSQGGSTLGMSWNHTHIRKFSLGEHAAEQRKAHRQLCSQQLDSTQNWNELSNISSEDSDSDEIVSDSEVDYENYNFLQPIPTRERRAMLRAAGIHKIDSREKDECRSIRLSREFCGCTCQIYCDPEICVCAQAGIKCQVDRVNFPCGCTRDGCANENGRIEFNPVRVRTHFIHTLMRLEMEKKKEEEEEHNHQLLFSDLDSLPQVSSYSPSSSLAPSSSASSGDCGVNLLTNFTYHPNSLSYYAQPSLPNQQQSSLYDVSSTSTTIGSENSQMSHSTFSYDSQQYVMAAADNSSYSQLTSVSSLTVLGDNGSSSMASGYAMSGEECLRLAAAANYEDVSTLAQMQQHQQPLGFSDVTTDLSATSAVMAAACHSVEPYDLRFMADETVAKECSLKCPSEGENLDTSAETSEETEKEEESDLENFGDIIKKTMVESVIV